MKCCNDKSIINKQLKYSSDLNKSVTVTITGKTTKPKKVSSKEERLQKKCLTERLRYEKIRNDLVRFAAEKEKNRQKYLRKKEKGQRKLVSEMSDSEKRRARKKWRTYSTRYYLKKKNLNKEDF